MRDPSRRDLFGNALCVHGLAQDLAPAHELPAEDPMARVRRAEGAAGVFDRGAKGTGGVLVLESLDALAIGALEEEADHRVGEASVDEIRDERPKRGLPADGLEIGRAHVGAPNTRCSSSAIALVGRSCAAPLSQ